VTKTNNRYYFDSPEFIGYDASPRVSLVEEKIIIHFGSTSFTAYIGTEWKFDNNDLILENISGVFPDNFDYDNRIKICIINGIYKSINDIDTEELLGKLIDEEAVCRYEYNNLPPLQDIYERVAKESRKDISFLKSQGTDINRYKSYLNTYPITNENHIKYNDIGYYLEQAECYEEAIYVLRKVLDQYPDRVVAYLNIADAYWGRSDTEEAGKSYRKYLELMKSQGKDLSRIPKRVYERVEK
jgi:tetratricopeptide (TPR) repeat protein